NAEEVTMKAVRSSERMRIRRELAQLLRRLRAIRRDKVSPAELAERVNIALAEARSIRRLVTIANVPETREGVCRSCLARVNKLTLAKAGFTGQEDDASRQPEAIAAGCL